MLLRGKRHEKKHGKLYIPNKKCCFFEICCFWVWPIPSSTNKLHCLQYHPPKRRGKKKHVGSSTNRSIFPVVVVGRSPRCQARVWRDTPVSSLLDLRAEGYKLHIKSMDFWCFFSTKEGRKQIFSEPKDLGVNTISYRNMYKNSIGWTGLQAQSQ